MSVLTCTLQGRFGNQAMQWLFAYAFATAHQLEFRCEEWIGERVFSLPAYGRPSLRRDANRKNELELLHWGIIDPAFRAPEVEFRGYAQCQACMVYTKRQAQSWLKLRPEVETACAHALLANEAKDAKVVCHQRRGDYFGYGYPVVSRKSYERACQLFGLVYKTPEAVFVVEDYPISHVGHLPDDLGFMPDFYRMMTAPTLLRGNSSFSWLAALLGDGLVLSPIVEGLEGGKEHDCAFVPGNHPRFANLDFVTDLHVSP